MGSSDKDKIIAGLFRLAWSFPFIFIGPALFIGKGTGEHWSWTAISLVIMGTGVFLAVSGLRCVLKGFFND
jgi:hypothetical protein